MTVVKSAYELSKNNLYQTPFWATQRLIDAFPVAGRRVWEPAAGNHFMADVLTINGASVFTSDIETYTRQHDCQINFLDPFPPTNFDAIITNPPYGPGNRLATAFVRLALERCSGGVAMLLTAKWDFGNTRFDLTRDNRRFAAKINLCDRCRWFDGPDTEDGTEDHAWYVWQATDLPPVRHPVIFYARK